MTEDASFVVGVMQFCAEGTDTAASTQEDFGCNERAQSWRGEVKPESMPVAHMQCWSKTSGGIHAHPGQRCFQDYESRVQKTNQVWCVAGKRFAIGRNEYCCHQDKRDQQLTHEGYCTATNAWCGYRVPYCVTA